MKSFLINDLKLHLVFRKVFCPQGIKYFVTESEAGNASLAFEMKEQEAGQWKIVLPAPDWLLPIEDELSEHINQIISEE